MKFAPKRRSPELDAPEGDEVSDLTASPADVSAPEEGSSSTDTRIESTRSGTTRLRRFTPALVLVSAFAAGAVTMHIADRNGVLASDVALAKGEVTTIQPTSSLGVISDAQAAAVSFRTRYGTFVGFTAPGLLTASNESTILLASAVDGTCVFTKIVETTLFEIASDPTGETCTEAMLASAQKVLESQDVTKVQESAVALASAVSAVSQAATLWASMSYDAAGRPSLLGLTTLPVPGSAVLSVAADGQTAVVQVATDGQCALVKVTALVDPTPRTTPCE
jgi:hypothetical protein